MIQFDIDLTCDLKKYIVLINTTGEQDGWQDLTKPFDTREEALEWVKKISSNYRVYNGVQERRQL